jgi:hypothetical protein
MFPSLFGHTNSPLRQRCLGSVLQQLDGVLTLWRTFGMGVCVGSAINTHPEYTPH